MQFNWTIDVGNVITMALVVGGGLRAFMSIRDTLQSVTFMVKEHEAKLDDHEDRLRYVERKQNNVAARH